MRKITLITRTQKFTRVTLYTVTKENPAPSPLTTSVWGECKTSDEVLKMIAKAGGVHPDGEFKKLPDGTTPVFAIVGETYDKLLVWDLMEIAKLATVTEPRGTVDSDDGDEVDA